MSTQCSIVPVDDDTSQGAGPKWRWPPSELRTQATASIGPPNVSLPVQIAGGYHRRPLAKPHTSMPRQRHERKPPSLYGRMGGVAPTRWRRLVAVLSAIYVAIAIEFMTPTMAEATNQQTNLRLEDVDNDVESARMLTVFGADDRRTVSDVSLYPYSAVGLLKWNKDHLCTAALVGSKYAVTAAECVLDSDGKRRPSTLPEPELIVGAGSSSSKTANVVKLHRQSEFWIDWTQETYVVLELDKNVGDTQGVLLLPTMGDLDDSINKTAVQMVGYDDDAAETATTALKFSKCTCYFPSTFQGEEYQFHHDCDTSTIGSPGSVLLVRYTSMETYIIGIHTNKIGDRATLDEVDQTLEGYSDDVANRGVLGPFIQKQLVAIFDAESEDSSGSSSSKKPSLKGSSSGSSPSSRDGVPTVGSGSDAKDPTAISPAEQQSIGTSAAYTCIGFVAVAWVCIIFIALRNMRSKKRSQEAYSNPE